MNYEEDIFKKYSDEKIPSILNSMVVSKTIHSLRELDSVGNSLYGVAKHYRYSSTLMFLTIKGSTELIYKEKEIEIAPTIEEPIIEKEVKEIVEEVIEEVPDNVEEEVEEQSQENKWAEQLTKTQSKNKPAPVKERINKKDLITNKTNAITGYVKTKASRIKDIHSRILNDPSKKRSLK